MKTSLKQKLKSVGWRCSEFLLYIIDNFSKWQNSECYYKFLVLWGHFNHYRKSNSVESDYEIESRFCSNREEVILGLANGCYTLWNRISRLHSILALCQCRGSLCNDEWLYDRLEILKKSCNICLKSLKLGIFSYKLQFLRVQSGLKSCRWFLKFLEVERGPDPWGGGP